MDTRMLGFNTKLVHAGIPDDPLGSVTTPIYQTSTFAFRNAQQGADRFAGKAEGFIYTRIGNPTIVALEQNVAQLENGFGATATASGMGAVSTAYMALLSALPTDGATVTETDYASYVRKSMTMASIFGTAPTGNSPAVLANAGAITFATATGNSTLNVVGWAIFDASTAGNLLAYGPVGTPAQVTNTSTPNFAIGALTISVQ